MNAATSQTLSSLITSSLPLSGCETLSKSSATMFSADLSWTDNTTEKVGQRRQRRDNKRENTISSSTASESNIKGREIHQQGHSSSGTVRKTISFSSVKESMRRPSTAASLELKAASVNVWGKIKVCGNYKDPAYQPNYTLSAKLGSRLPSGAEIGSPPTQHVNTAFVLPERQTVVQQEPVHEHWSNPPVPRQEHSAWSVNSQMEADNICQSYEQVKNEILALHNPESILPQPEAIYSPCLTYDGLSSCCGNEMRNPAPGCSLSIECHGQMHIEKKSSRVEDSTPLSAFEPRLELPPNYCLDMGKESQQSKSNAVKVDKNISAKTSRWSAPKDWNVVKSQGEIHTLLDSESSNDDSSGDHRRQSIFVGSHFERFVRRMESAGPRIILERLSEDWALPGDRDMSDELQLEQHLWALTALQLPSMDRFVKSEQHNAPCHPLPPTVSRRRRRILELDGSVGEVYQLSAIYPDSRIYHLTRSSRSSSIQLPSQAIQHEISAGSPGNSLAHITPSSAAGILALPYANASMHHIRSTRMPTLMAGSQLPVLLSECYRILKPGGILELRLMDATPERCSMGPLLATWLENRLLVDLEAEFKCTRPVSLIPRWARNAGFMPLSADILRSADMNESAAVPGLHITLRCLQLPAVASAPHSPRQDVTDQVGVLVSRALWKDVWGTYVCGNYEQHWWWENSEIVEECREYATSWDVSTIIMMKTFAASI